MQTCSASKFHIEGGAITGVDAICTPSQERGTPGCVNEDETTKSFNGVAVVLATGHSARDVYYELSKSGVELEAKGFAVGFRVEHPQVEYKYLSHSRFSQTYCSLLLSTLR